MPDFVRVKVKETGAEITIDRINVTDGMTVLDKPAVQYGKPLPPKPRKNLKSAVPAVASSDTDDGPSEESPKPNRGRRTAGKPGTSEESS